MVGLSSTSSNRTIRVFTGGEALKLMECDAFRSEWNSLYESCQWATTAQSPDVTTLRCDMYRSKTIPVLVEQRESGALVGLLALGKPKSGTRTLGAICEDGEYHTWIADSKHAESFMPNALAVLWSNTNLPPINLTYIPPGTPLEWLNHGHWKTCSVLKPRQTRILRLLDPEKVQVFLRSKARLRSKRNQLNRLGKLAFRKVEGIHDFERVWDRFVEMYQLRKQPILGSTVFDSDPIKRAYILARQGSVGMQHTTVLELDGKPIAAHIGLEGRPGGVFSLAGITHDPAYDKYSPGSLLLVDLINLLCDEGYSVFDLTPGGALYKDRWGDAEEMVYELEIFPSRFQRLAAASLDISARGFRKLKRFARKVEAIR